MILGAIIRPGILSITTFVAILLYISFSSNHSTIWTVRPAQVTTNKTIADGMALRILPIGDSITQGYMSTDGNGYRLYLRNLLIGSNSKVQFIGSEHDGDNNTDNHHEGFGGLRTSQIQARLASDGVLTQHPNVVLIHVGSNDIDQIPAQEPYEGAPDRLASLIDTVLAGCPDAVVLVALIINITKAQDRVHKYNSAIPSIVATRRAAGHKIQIVDQSHVGGSDLADGLHPNDGGYEKIAQNWYHSIQVLPAGWIVPARDG